MVVVVRQGYLRCFLVGLPCVVGRWLRIFGREGNIVYKRDRLLRCGGPVVGFGN